jgi:hypothetical protein
MIVFQGLEWNIPGGDHCSVIMPPSAGEAKLVAKFEALFDEQNLSRPDTEADTEDDAIAGIKHIQALTPKPLLFVNHPGRLGVAAPHEFRNWADAGPEVMRGFEGTPGHHASPFEGIPRGWYDGKNHPNSWPDYPKEAYHTWGGYDWCVAKTGGLWDSLLGEGRPWFITSNSDSHRHFKDKVPVDTSTFNSLGYVTPRAGAPPKKNVDFHPGEYNKTWVSAAGRDPSAVLEGMRAGNMFAVIGDLIDRLEFTAQTADTIVPMGGTLALEKRRSDVTVTIRVRPSPKPNFGGRVAELHHIDVIAGRITGPSWNRDAMNNATTEVVAQKPAAEARRDDNWLVFEHEFQRVEDSFYVRVRGTSTKVHEPSMDPLTVNPWDDLWFYGNPIFIRVPA